MENTKFVLSEKQMPPLVQHPARPAQAFAAVLAPGTKPLGPPTWRPFSDGADHRSARKVHRHPEEIQEIYRLWTTCSKCIIENPGTSQDFL
jgi:hypothetical protein